MDRPVDALSGCSFGHSRSSGPNVLFGTGLHRVDATIPLCPGLGPALRVSSLVAGLAPCLGIQPGLCQLVLSTGPPGDFLVDAFSVKL